MGPGPRCSSLPRTYGKLRFDFMSQSETWLSLDHNVQVGVIAAVFINLANQPHYKRAVEKNKGRAVPEARLPPMMIGGWLFVIGIFW